MNTEEINSLCQEVAQSLIRNALLIVAKERDATRSPKEEIEHLERVLLKHIHLPELVRIAKMAAILFSATDKAELEVGVASMYKLESATKAFNAGILDELKGLGVELKNKTNSEVPAANHNN